MASFWIEYKDVHTGCWRRYGEKFTPSDGTFVQGTKHRWDVACGFPVYEYAIDAVVAWGRRRSASNLRIVDEYGLVVWEQGHPVNTDAPATAGGTNVSQYEEKKPLHVPTGKLIARLQERATEERERREKAEQAVADKRRELTEAIMALSEDELTNLVGQHVTQDPKWFVDAKEAKKFVSKESVPTPIETTLEKQIRVLKMASDEQIEVTPDEQIYQLL